MSGELPNGDSEGITACEIENLAEYNDHLLEAAYQESANILRADTILLLGRQGLSETKMSWLYYRYRTEESVLGLESASQFKDVLIYHDATRKCDGAPLLRTVVNELYWDQGNDLWYVMDAMLDFNNDARYAEWMLELNQSMSSRCLKSTAAPFFWTEDQKLGITKNAKNTTPIIKLEDNLAPLGMYGNFEDRLYALDKFRSILKEVYELDPLYEGSY